MNSNGKNQPRNWPYGRALGCNVGAFFVRTANGDISGWSFGLGMIGGAYIGVKFFNWYTERKMAKEMANINFDL
jgi:hypothetical protein